MKIKFKKDISDYKKGDVNDVNDWRANYWIKTGVAEEATKKKEKKAPAKSEDKNGKPTSETK